jgi:hypothetical protein
MNTQVNCATNEARTKNDAGATAALEVSLGRSEVVKKSRGFRRAIALGWLDNTVNLTIFISTC